ncbi:MAG: hypothetical protein HGA90_05615, partial [Alphaproteobacteria bacterium]|nr:hypothetical protein [Alphaproteobacteria bacterium]
MRARIGFCLIAFVSLLGAASPAGADNRASIAAARQNATNDATLVPSSPSLGSVVPPVAAQEYVLCTGDRVRLTVYGEDDLSGEYEVNSTGRVALPLVGNIDAANRTVREFEEVVRAQLNKGYLKNPRVSAQVASYRPFFILGEVAKPGNYAYVNG